MNANIYNNLFCKSNICLMAKNNTTTVNYVNGGEVLKNDLLKIESITFINESFYYTFSNCIQNPVDFDYLYKNFIPQII